MPFELLKGLSVTEKSAMDLISYGFQLGKWTEVPSLSCSANSSCFVKQDLKDTTPIRIPCLM